MSFDPHNTSEIAIGTPVTGYDGALLGQVREVYPHFLLVGTDGQHNDLEVPVHAIKGFAGGQLQVSITRESASEVDDVETAHRLGQE